LASGGGATADTRLLSAEQSNSSVAFGETFFLKLYRRVDEGLNPDLEIGRFLTEQGFEHTARVAGALELKRGGRRAATTLGILHGYVANEGDAWSYTLDHLHGYVESVLARASSRPDLEVPTPSLFDVAVDGAPDLAVELIESFLAAAGLLGRRTGDMHVALGGHTTDAAFRPEPISPHDQRALYQSLRGTANRAFRALRRHPDLPGAEDVLGRQPAIFERLHDVLEVRISGSRIRVHGDFHLGQVLWTGRDFVLIDFEGEPARPLGERRIKRLPLVDVAGMIRSFDYAVNSAVRSSDLVEEHDRARIRPWARLWYASVAGTFLREYLQTVQGSRFHPGSEDEMRILLEAYLLDKALYEVTYEADNRPDWLPIPAAGIVELLEGRAATTEAPR